MDIFYCIQNMYVKFSNFFLYRNNQIENRTEKTGLLIIVINFIKYFRINKNNEYIKIIQGVIYYSLKFFKNIKTILVNGDK